MPISPASLPCSEVRLPWARARVKEAHQKAEAAVREAEAVCNQSMQAEEPLLPESCKLEKAAETTACEGGAQNFAPIKTSEESCGTGRESTPAPRARPALSSVLEKALASLGRAMGCVPADAVGVEAKESG
jgi:Xaa-Pro aminopeptidase